MRLGVKPSIKIEKPEALMLLEQCRAMDLPLISGGLLDQPHIWVMEVAVCTQEEQRFAAIDAANRSLEKP